MSLHLGAESMIFRTEPHPNGKDIIVYSQKPESWRCASNEEEVLAAIGARYNRKASVSGKVVYTATRAQWRDLCRLVDAGWRGDRWALANPKDLESRTFWHPDYGDESFSRADALALCPPVAQRCKRTRDLFPPQEPQGAQQDVDATQVAPAPEIAPTACEAAELTPADAAPDIAAIIARLDAVESAVAELPRIRMKAIAVRIDELLDTPVDSLLDAPLSGEIGTDAPNVIAWPGARAMHADRAANDAERKARERAKRERLVRRYLAMRKERSQWRKLAEKNAAECIAMRRVRDHFEGVAIRSLNKRRPAVILARDLQKRLNAEHRLVDQMQQKHGKACEHNRRLNNELSALKAKIECPSTPDRVSDVAMLRAENSAVRDELALVKADRDRLAKVADNHAGAIGALVDRIARAEALMRRAGIVAGPVAVAA
jgi:hypothetical protein